MFSLSAQGESQTTPAPPKVKLRWYQFRLRTLLFGVFLASLATSWFAVRMQRAREQDAAVRELGKFEGTFIYYDCEVENRLGFGPEEKNTPRGPAWLRGLLGDDFFNDVTRVSFGSPEVTDENLIHLRAFPRLRHLLLDGTQVTDDGIRHLESLTSLELLSLNHLKITDRGLVHLRPLTGIRWLDLGGTRVEGTGLAYLEKWTKLESLSLCSTSIRDEELARLQHFTSLQYLELGGTRISDAGIKHLKRMHQLRELSLWNTRVTDAGVRDLQAALPHCEIKR